jgi:hypothetical protein
LISETIYYRVGKTSNDVTLDFEEWMSVVKLSKKWNLTELFSRATDSSERCMIGRSSVDKILNGKKFDVKKWMREGYREICARTNAIAQDEKSKLDFSTYVALLELRDRVTEWLGDSRSSGFSSRRRDNFDYDEALSALIPDDKEIACAKEEDKSGWLGAKSKVVRNKTTKGAKMEGKSFGGWGTGGWGAGAGWSEAPKPIFES